jgi:hypothetical protein
VELLAFDLTSAEFSAYQKWNNTNTVKCCWQNTGSNKELQGAFFMSMPTHDDTIVNLGSTTKQDRYMRVVMYSYSNQLTSVYSYLTTIAEFQVGGPGRVLYSDPSSS